MSATVVIGVGPPQAGSVRRNKPRKLYRGVKRTLIRKTLAKLNSIQNQDFRENSRGALLNYSPALVMDSPNSVLGRAFTRVMERLQTCLDAVEGDQ